MSNGLGVLSKLMADVNLEVTVMVGCSLSVICLPEVIHCCAEPGGVNVVTVGVKSHTQERK